jgi:hypothetical protein
VHRTTRRTLAARYEARRRAAVRLVRQNTADRISWLSDLTNPMLRWLATAVRHLGSWLVGGISLRLVEQSDPLWLRIVASNPRGDVTA